MDEAVAADATDTGSTPAGGSVPGSTPGAPDGSGQASTPESVAAAGSTPATSAEGADEPQEWRNFQAKYTKDGTFDKAAAAKSFWEASRSGSAAAERARQLEARIAEMERTPKAPPQPPPTPPRLDKLDQRIKSFETEKQQLNTDRNAIVSQVRGLDRSIAVLEDKLAGADPMDQPALQARLEQAKAAHASALLNYKRMGAEMARIDQFMEDTQERRSAVERELEVEKERQTQAEADAARFNEEFPRTVDGYIEQAAKDILPGVPAGYDTPVWKIVNALTTMDYFIAAQQPASQVDAQALVRSHLETVKGFVEEVKRGAFGAASAATLQVKKPVGQPSAVPAARPAAEATQKPRWQQEAESDWRNGEALRRARGESTV